MSKPIKNIGIIGLGLIGGSMAKDFKHLKVADYFLGYDKNKFHAERAKELGIVDELLLENELIKRSDIIILSIPVNHIETKLSKILDQVEDQIVLETGSTKRKILDGLVDHPKRGNLVSIHPMAGTEYTGPDAAVFHLFDKKCCVFVDAPHSDPEKILTVEKLMDRIGMYNIKMQRAPHDLHAAYVSHISHITSFALANTVLEKEKDEAHIFEMASGGFSSTVRLAKSSPAMWGPIFLQNKIQVLDVLEEHISQLNYFKNCIEKEDEKAMIDWMKKANRINRIIK